MQPLISIIDDDASMRTALTGFVRSIGYEARSFASAEEFLASAGVVEYSCVITDIKMPGMSGFDLKRVLAAQKGAPPVIMITAHTLPGLDQKAIESGAVGFLTKPFTAAALLVCLEKALRP
jgi:FixJ family two-component response regulator